MYRIVLYGDTSSFEKGYLYVSDFKVFNVFEKSDFGYLFWVGED